MFAYLDYNIFVKGIDRSFTIDYNCSITTATRDRFIMETMEKTKVLSALDRCDHSNCNAQAFVLVKFLDGELAFCGHHFSKHEDALFESAYDIVDEREFINNKSQSSV